MFLLKYLASSAGATSLSLYSFCFFSLSLSLPWSLSFHLALCTYGGSLLHPFLLSTPLSIRSVPLSLSLSPVCFLIQSALSLSLSLCAAPDPCIYGGAFLSPLLALPIPPLPPPPSLHQAADSGSWQGVAAEQGIWQGFRSQTTRIGSIPKYPNVHTRTRTWVVAATTRRPNH